jgi:aspartyl-tRNA(Asn)/glutamyl-tRNA(Gln) amidotransferase subunit A
MDAILRQANVDRLHSLPVSKAVFAVPTHHFLDCLDSEVSAAFDRALVTLSQQGARLVKIDIPEIQRMQRVNENGGFAAAESFRLHRRLGFDSAAYDPLVWARIQRGADIGDSEYAAMVQERISILAAFAQRNIFDGILCPTVPIVAPPVSDLTQGADFHRINLLLLRNPAFANFMDLCSISLPCHEGDAPVGLMITGRKDSDNELLACARGVEEALLAFRPPV